MSAGGRPDLTFLGFSAHYQTNASYSSSETSGQLNLEQLDDGSQLKGGWWSKQDDERL